MQSGKPLYLAGLLGGATEQVIDAFEGKPMPEDFCRADDMQKLYSKEATLDDGSADREINPPQVWSYFGSIGVNGLAQANGLSADDNRKLFHTPVLDQAIGLILDGKLHRRAEALQLYQEAIVKESQYTDYKAYAERRIQELSTSNKSSQ